MRALTTLPLLLALAALAGPGLSAGEAPSNSLAVRTPKAKLGVICDYRVSRNDVEAFARTVDADTTLLVVDVRHPEQASHAAKLLADAQVDFVVQLPHDRVAGAGTFGASLADRHFAQRGLRTVSSDAARELRLAALGGTTASATAPKP